MLMGVIGHSDNWFNQFGGTVEGGGFLPASPLGRKIAGPDATATGGPVGAPSAGDPQGYFNQLFPGETLTPDMLTQHEADLQRAGISLVRNAAGVPGKIKLPNGSVIDVIQGAGSGLNRKQWLTGDGGGPNTSGMSGGTLGSLGFGSLAQGPQLSVDQLRQTPGYQFAFDQGQQAIQRSAASKGTLLTGGTMKALAGYGTGLADQTYGQAFDRARNVQNDVFNRYYSLGNWGMANPGA